MPTPAETITQGRGRAAASCVDSEGGRPNQGSVTRLDHDRELVEALREREPTAAESLVATYGDRAYRLAIRITGHAQDAEEVVQDAFWNVIQKIESFRGESAFGSWLFRIVTNAAYQNLRRRHSRHRDVSWDEVFPVFDEGRCHVMPVPDWSWRVNDPSAQSELRAVLTAAINDLPPTYRTPLVLRDVEGRSNLEVAELLCLSTPAVKARLHRARSFLRKQLSDAVATLDATTASKTTHELIPEHAR
jgi:RNA polymerase sigma-70 factor, ECF subfamily